MMELIHLTAQYSNAVMLAVLPHISQFAAKLDLPIPQPITPAQVARAVPSLYKGYIAAGVTLTNGYWFLFHWHGYDGKRGYVQSFRAPTNWFFEQEFTDESAIKYFGEDHMTTNEVIAMAKETLGRLGLKPELTHSYETPALKGPFDIQRLHRHVPYCRVIWEWPKTENLADLSRIAVEINLQTKALVGLELVFSRTNNPPTTPIQVDVVPELERDYQERMRASGKMFFNTNAPPRFPQKSL